MSNTKTVTLAADISGLRDGAPWPSRGESVDLPADEADAMVDSGLAIWPADEPETPAPEQPETSTPEQPETPTPEQPETSTPEQPETPTPEQPETAKASRARGRSS